MDSAKEALSRSRKGILTLRNSALRSTEQYLSPDGKARFGERMKQDYAVVLRK